MHIFISFYPFLLLGLRWNLFNIWICLRISSPFKSSPMLFVKMIIFRGCPLFAFIHSHICIYLMRIFFLEYLHKQRLLPLLQK